MFPYAILILLSTIGILAVILYLFSQADDG